MWNKINLEEIKEISFNIILGLILLKFYALLTIPQGVFTAKKNLNYDWNMSRTNIFMIFAVGIIYCTKILIINPRGTLK